VPREQTSDGLARRWQDALPVDTKGGRMRLRGLAHSFAVRFLRAPRLLALKRRPEANGDWLDDYKGFGIVLASRRTEIHTASFSVTRTQDNGTVEILALERVEGKFATEAQAKRAARSAARWLIDSISARN
jgi:hypothetical protein